MVSSVLNMEPDELLKLLQRIAGDSLDDPDYQELRAGLPAEWPI